MIKKPKIILKDSITVLLLPFSYERGVGGEVSFLSPESSIWERTHNFTVDKNYLYSHIQKFLTGNAVLSEDATIDTQDCVMYNLKDNIKDVAGEDSCILKVFRDEMQLENKDETERSIGFRLLNEKRKMSSPKLILHLSSSMGILVLSFEPVEGSNTQDDLIILNNRLHKIKGEHPLICFKSSAQVNEKKQKERDKIHHSLHKYQLFKTGKKEITGWYFHNLISFLLYDFNRRELAVNIFNDSRFHLCTYFLVDFTEGDNGVIRDFIRISKGQDTKYKIMENDMEYGQIYTQTFENIYLASSIEGAAIMTDSQQGESKFIDEFKGHFLSRYLWIYLLAFLQRHILVTLSKELMDIDIDVDQNIDSKQKLIDKFIKQSKIKVNTYFTSISDYTQHNTFYRFCVKQLAVKQHFDEIKEKINDLDVILKEKELKIKEQELKQKDEAERSDKERNENLQKMLGRLIIPQIFLALMAFLNITFDLKELLTDCYYCIFVFIACVLCICLYFFVNPVFRLFRSK